MEQGRSRRAGAHAVPDAARLFATAPTCRRARCLRSPARRLRALFDQLRNPGDVGEVVRRSAAHEVDFLPPGSVPGA
jgi:hypothetical protein